MQFTDKQLRESLHDSQGEQARDQILYSWVADNTTPPIKKAAEWLKSHVRGLSPEGAYQVIAMLAVEQWKYYEEHPDEKPNVKLR